MADSNPSPANVVLPGFQETFSDVLRRYPVDTQQKSPHSSIPVANNRGPCYPSGRYEPGEPSRVASPSAVAHRNLSSHEQSQRPYDDRRRQGSETHLRAQNPASSYPIASDNGVLFYETGHKHDPANRVTVQPDHIFSRDQDMSEGVRTRKRHVCSVCDKDFLRPSSLETHMNSHTGAKPHKCTHPGCDKCFSAKSNMKRHLRKHYAPDDATQDGNSDDMNEDEP